MKEAVQGDLLSSPKQLVPGADLCASRHRGAGTSVEAFRTTPSGTRALQRERVLRFIADRGGDGGTCEEASIALGIPYTAASARITELRCLGLIEFKKDRRPTTHGKSARVYRVRKGDDAV